MAERDRKETHSDRGVQFSLTRIARSCQELPLYLANGGTVMDSQDNTGTRLMAAGNRKETHSDRKGQFSLSIASIVSCVLSKILLFVM